MEKNITISIDRYKELLAAEFELDALKLAGVDEVDGMDEFREDYIRSYCENEPDILLWFRENSFESADDIIDRLWFEDLAEFDVEYYCDQEEVINYYDSREIDEEEEE